MSRSGAFARAVLTFLSAANFISKSACILARSSANFLYACNSSDSDIGPSTE